MKGAFLIITLISLLIVGVLVMKNTKEHQAEDSNKIEAVQKAKDSVKGAQDTLDAAQKRMQKAEE